jgi:hypothetical protein
MAPQEWMTPESGAGTPAAGQFTQAAAPRTAAAFELRPLSLGEILDRTFVVYRTRFWLFAGLGSVSGAFQALLGAVQLIPMHMGNQRGIFNPTGAGTASSMSPAAAIAFGLTLIVLGLGYMLAFAVTQAATVYALSEVYLGRPVTIMESVKAVYRKWYRQIAISIWQACSLMWLPTLLIFPGFILLAVGGAGLKIVGGLLLFLGFCGGLPAGVVLSLRNSLGVQATVIESLPVVQSMRRSKVLTSGAKGRIFMVGLVSGVLSWVAGAIQTPLLIVVTLAIAKGKQAIVAEVAMLLVSFAAHSVVSPVLMIGLSLVYFDQRVRKEALDLVMLMGEETPVTAAQSFVPAAAVESTVVEPAAEPMMVAESLPVDEPAVPAQVEEILPKEDTGHDGDAPSH